MPDDVKPEIVQPTHIRLHCPFQFELFPIIGGGYIPLIGFKDHEHGWQHYALNPNLLKSLRDWADNVLLAMTPAASEERQ